MALPPPLSSEQRQQALEKASETRRQRAALKGELRSGKATLPDVLARTGDEIVGKMRVSDVLQTMRGVGKVRAKKIMTRLDIAESRRMRGLGAKQIESLLREFTEK
ncbi:MAG: integration host factor, actinobacterial type [Actinomycetota bacterium]